MARYGGADGLYFPAELLTGFDRTFGGLFDALGFGPMRKLQAAWQELAMASLAQNQSRAAYAMHVQGAFTTGPERLMMQLATMADAGERVESVLTLLKMWAVKTEEAVHEVLQSDQGLVATAALTRRGCRTEKTAACRGHRCRFARHGNASRTRPGLQGAA